MTLALLTVTKYSKTGNLNLFSSFVRVINASTVVFFVYVSENNPYKHVFLCFFLSIGKKLPFVEICEKWSMHL